MTQEINLNENEEFTEIRGFEHYLISNQGRVFNTRTHRELGNVMPNGYIHVNLSNGKDDTQNYYIHRLVMEHFGPPAPEGMNEIDHIDRDRTNNRLENLRWCTHSENIRNQAGRGRNRFNYIDELPETAEQLDAYNGHEFDGLYVDHEEEKLYVFNGLQYRELRPSRINGSTYYQTKDINGRGVALSHLILFG